MDDRKTLVRFFTVADYEEEEQWLRRQHQSGWKLVKTVLPCFFVFERCAPADVVYRLHYKNDCGNGDYFQLLQDYGWTYFNRCMGWLYFRRPVAETDAAQELELFSDDASRVEMLQSIVRTRMLPLLVIFFACLLPQFIRSVTREVPFANGFTVIFSVLLLLYLFLFVYCGGKLRRLKKKYGKTP